MLNASDESSFVDGEIADFDSNYGSIYDSEYTAVDGTSDEGRGSTQKLSILLVKDIRNKMFYNKTFDKNA